MINKKRVIDTFFDYVKIDSETLHEKDMMNRIINDLSDIGISVEQDNAGIEIGSDGNNIYCHIDGDSNYEPLMLSAHMDTVKPGKNIEPYLDDDGYIKSKTNTILGSDDKAGIVAIIEALRVIKNNNFSTRPLDIVFTLAEEGYILGAKHVEFGRIKAKKALILDSSGDIGHIIVNAPAKSKISATIYGKTAHAGFAPESGISSIMVMSEAISHMKLLRIDEETTANIGSFNASSPINIVCDKATIEGEVRSRDSSKLDKQIHHMTDCLYDACNKYGAKLELNINSLYKSYNISENDEIVTFVKNTCKKMNIKPLVHAGGGGSDANIYNDRGLKTIVLGIGMENAHTVDEKICLNELLKLCELTLNMMII